MRTESEILDQLAHVNDQHTLQLQKLFRESLSLADRLHDAGKDFALALSTATTVIGCMPTGARTDARHEMRGATRRLAGK